MKADMDHLAGEIQKYQEGPRVENYSDKEVLKKSIQSMAPSPEPPRDNQGQIEGDPLASLNSAPPAAKLEVEHLLSLAFKEGVVKAIGEASKSSPFVLDAFHDALTGQLYEEFKRRGIIKQ